MKLRLSGIVRESIVDGEGIRCTVFAQGCPHRCEGCHNPQTHDFSGGKDWETDEVIKLVQKNPLLDGVTLSGGEPFAQAEAFARLAEQVNAMGLNVWAYSGYTFEELFALSEKNESIARLLQAVKVLVDGRFELKNRSLNLPFMGSTNQRLIDVKRSLQAKKAVLYELE